MKSGKSQRKLTISTVLVGLLLSPGAAGAAPSVVVTLKPIHSLVAGVMGDLGEPVLLVGGAFSEHAYQMKPSDAAALQGADLIIRADKGLERFLEKPLESFGGHAQVLTLSEVDGLKLLPFREDDIWAPHADEEPEAHAAGEADHAQAEGNDPHVWLSPDNARLMVKAILDALVGLDRGMAPTYAANAERVLAEIDRVDAESRALLTPVRDRPYVVFHDGYQYFEDHYGLSPAGSITVNPELQPSAAHLRELRATIRERGARCIFSEPQFESRLVATVVEGLDVRTGTLDPLGATLTPGPGLYPRLLLQNAEALAACLGDAG